jgi:hypothetical protein
LQGDNARYEVSLLQFNNIFEISGRFVYRTGVHTISLKVPLDYDDPKVQKKYIVPVSNNTFSQFQALGWQHYLRGGNILRIWSSVVSLS